ncbi:MAG: outer membrane protein assembly factor BamB family protein [Planctomycetota bacterium]|jgi:outer membrane protein assembly factor BamB
MNTLYRSLPLVIAATLCLPALADWPRFHGPNGAGKATGLYPTDWSETQNIAWKTALPGRGASSPVTFNNRIYLTAFTGYGVNAENPGVGEDRTRLTLHLLAFDRATGKPVFDTPLPASKNEQEMVRQLPGHGYASSTPVADDTGVYVNFGVSGAVAFDHNGKVRWQKHTGTGTRGFGSAASPVLYKNLVIVNASIETQAVIAYDKTTGDEAWRAEGIDSTWTTPLVAKAPDGRDELVVSFKENIHGLDPNTGKTLWTCQGIEDYVVPSPVHHDGVVYCLGGRSNQAIAVRLGGRGDVSKTHVLWSERIGANLTTPIYHEGRLYWASDKGIAICLDARTGQKIYQERLGSTGRLYGSPVFANGKLYVTTRLSGFFIYDARPEFKTPHNIVFTEDDGPFQSTPALDGGQILIRSDRYLYCVGKSNVSE